MSVRQISVAASTVLPDSSNPSNFISMPGTTSRDTQVQKRQRCLRLIEVSKLK